MKVGVQTDTLSQVISPKVKPGTVVITTRPDALKDGSPVASQRRDPRTQPAAKAAEASTSTEWSAERDNDDYESRGRRSRARAGRLLRRCRAARRRRKRADRHADPGTDADAHPARRLPYPAYGTPAPDVAQLQQKPASRYVVNLAQAIEDRGRALAAFATQNAQWAAIHAKYTSRKQALFPAATAQRAR